MRPHPVTKAMLSQRFDFRIAHLINSPSRHGQTNKRSCKSVGWRLMRKPGETLEDLRGEIDQIDDAVHDLLMRRAELTGEVAKVKQTGDRRGNGLAPAFHPAREAAILRRLISRHKGPLPERVLARIWREIIAASLRAQTEFQLHVYAGDTHSEFVDLAHGHFGSFMRVRTHTRPSLVVHACAEEPDSIGVVPL